MKSIMSWATSRVVQVALAAVALVATSVSLSLFATVTLLDIPPKFGLKHQTAIEVQAGDLYAVSADGTRNDRLCSLVIRDGAVREAAVDAVYRNSIADWVPMATFLVGKEGQGRLPGQTQLRFVGRYTEFREAPIATIPPDCERQALQRVLAREKLCYVDRSLVALEAGMPFSAMVFEEHALFLPESLYEAHGFEMPDWAQVPPLNACLNAPDIRLPWAVEARKRWIVTGDGADQPAGSL